VALDVDDDDDTVLDVGDDKVKVVVLDGRSGTLVDDEDIELNVRDDDGVEVNIGSDSDVVVDADESPIQETATSSLCTQL